MAERLEIAWPGGEVEKLENIDANQIVTITEGRGVTAKEPFRKN
jgi:hypothetical protein